MYATSLAAHLQECLLHSQNYVQTCSGTLRSKKGRCNAKAVVLLERVMPLCRIHQDQRKQSTWCRARLSCGFECGRICEWEPHRFQLCEEHREHSMPCYLLKIPIETRLRIYAFLLPDQPIPACWTGPCLTSDHGPVFTAILRTNRQIYDEAANLLYSMRTFTVEIASEQLVMCNSSRAARHGSNALQDYQMQLMLLEQQNRRRLLAARQAGPTPVINSSESSRSSIFRSINNTRRFPGSSALLGTCYEPVWDPPLSMANNFDKIQSFHIDIYYPPTSGPNSASRRRTASPESDRKNLQTILYDYCDNIHHLVARLLLIGRPLAQLKVALRFGRCGLNREELASAAHILLRPFQRLRNVGRVTTPLILVNNSEDQYVELPDRSNGLLSIAELEFQDYLDLWLKEVTSSQPFLAPPIFTLYWHLRQILDGIKGYHFPSRFHSFTDLLSTARVAREADDPHSFREVWEEVRKLWDEYVDHQVQWRKGVEAEMSDLGRMIEQ